MYVLIDGSFRPLEQAKITPVLNGRGVSVVISYQDSDQNIEFSGSEATEVLGDVLRRRIGKSPNAAIEAFFTAIEREKSLVQEVPSPAVQQVLEQGARTRRPRTLRNRQRTSQISSIKASIRWARHHGDTEKFKRVGKQALEMGLPLKDDVLKELAELGVK